MNSDQHYAEYKEDGEEGKLPARPRKKKSSNSSNSPAPALSLEDEKLALEMQFQELQMGTEGVTTAVHRSERSGAQTQYQKSKTTRSNLGSSSVDGVDFHGASVGKPSYIPPTSASASGGGGSSYEMTAPHTPATLQDQTDRALALKLQAQENVVAEVAASVERIRIEREREKQAMGRRTMRSGAMPRVVKKA